MAYMESLRKGLGRRLQQLRKAADLTQQQLADRVRMDWKYLGSIERGERNVTIDNIERILKALGAEPYEAFLFSFKARPRENLDEQLLLRLVRNTDRNARPLIVDLVQAVLTWAQRSK